MDYLKGSQELDNVERRDEAIYLCKELIRQARDRGDYHFKLFFEGQLNAINGVYDEALTRMRKAIELDPQNILFLVNTGVCCACMNRVHEAMTCFDQALSIDQNNLKALVNKAHILTSMGELRRALNVYDHVLKLEPENLQALLYRGIALQKTGSQEQALEDLESVLTRQPQNPLALMHKGFALLDMGQDAEALPHLQEALKLDHHNPSLLGPLAIMYMKRGKYEEALPLIDRALAMDPRNSDLLSHKGKALGELGYHQEALSFYDLALDIDCGNITAWRGKGESLNALGAHEDGLACFEEALRIDTSNLEALLSKINSLNYMGNYREALDGAEKALQIDSGHPGIHMEKGLSYYGLGMYKQALEIFDYMLQKSPRNVKVLHHKGLALEKTGHFAEALQCFRSVRQEMPHDATALQHLAFNLARLGNHQEVVEICDEALLITPNSHEALNLKGHALLELKFFKEALLYFNKALEINETYSSSILGKGRALSSQGAWKEALSYFEACYEKDPGNAALQSEMGGLCIRLGRYQDALNHYDKTLEMQPKNIDVSAFKVIALERVGRREEAAHLIYRVQKMLHKNDPRRAFFEFKYRCLTAGKGPDSPLTAKPGEGVADFHDRFLNELLNDFWMEEVEHFNGLRKKAENERVFITSRGPLLLTRESPDPFIHFSREAPEPGGAAGTIIITARKGISVNPGKDFLDYIMESPFHLSDLDLLIMTRKSPFTAYLFERFLMLLARARQGAENKVRQDMMIELQRKLQNLVKDGDPRCDEIQRMLESACNLHQELPWKKIDLIVSAEVYRLTAPLLADFREFIGSLTLLDTSADAVPLHYGGIITVAALPGADSANLIISVPGRNIIYADSAPRPEGREGALQGSTVMILSQKALYSHCDPGAPGFIEGLYGGRRGFSALSWLIKSFNPHLIVLNEVEKRYEASRDRLASRITGIVKRPCIAAREGLEISLDTLAPRCRNCHKFLTLEMLAPYIFEGSEGSAKGYLCAQCI